MLKTWYIAITDKDVASLLKEHNISALVMRGAGKEGPPEQMIELAVETAEDAKRLLAELKKVLDCEVTFVGVEAT